MRRGSVATATLALSGFLGLALIAAQDQFFSIDHATRALVRLVQSPTLDPAMRGASFLGEGAGLIPLIALTAGLLWRSSRAWAIVLPALMAGTGLLQWVAKWAVDRSRPNLAEWGFPSGHVLSLAVFFGLLAYLLWRSSSGWAWRCLGGAGCTATVVTVAFSRLYLEAHWVSDVAGGFLLGIAYLLATIWLVEALARRRGRPRELRESLTDA
jgi:undecaprenyl-diphosphatase